MTKFIELPVVQDEESKIELINIGAIGRIYPDPQSSRRCIVELMYQSINDAPVHLEVELPYDTLRAQLM